MCDLIEYDKMNFLYWTEAQYGGVQILPQKAFERGFIHMMAYAENLNFTTYSSNEFSVQIRWN